MQDMLGPIKESLLNFIEAYPFLWFVIALLFIISTLISTLAKSLPQLDIIKSKVLLPIVRRYKHRQLVKSAIRSDVRGHVNREIKKMRKYLPSSWSKDMDLDWVPNEDARTFLAEGKIVIRVRPVEDQDSNFVNAIYHYFKTNFFPKAQNVVPQAHMEASVLHTCRSIANARSESTKEVFEDKVLEPAVSRHKKIPDYLADYESLDEKGFFTGAFLRELHLACIYSRFTPNRNNIANEVSEIMKHIKSFSENIGNEDGIPSTHWYKTGDASSYGILLVAKPIKTTLGIDAYINRANEHIQSGAKRLYVFGSNSESAFAKAVVVGISASIDGCQLIEEFETRKDYRGNPKGVGAVFVVNS